MKLALSILCENPRSRTGLTTFFHEFIRHALVERPEVSWVIFAGPDQCWELSDPRLEVDRNFPANDRPLARLWADQCLVGPAAAKRGARALLTVGFMPLRTGGLPVVMQVFSVHHLRKRGLRAWYRQIMVKRGLRRASLIITNSDWAARQLGLTRVPVLVSYEGVQHDRFHPQQSAVEECPQKIPKNYLLWSSNLYAYKRIELAISAYAGLPDTLRMRFPLVVLGGDWHGGRARAEASARSHGVSENVRFMGWVDDAVLPGYYRGARALILSSEEETFGRCVLEALASGCPCVLQDLPVLREVTAGAAEFVDFAKVGEATAALARILGDDHRTAKLSANGLKRAQDFNFAKLARERLATILRTLTV